MGDDEGHQAVDSVGAIGEHYTELGKIEPAGQIGSVAGNVGDTPGARDIFHRVVRWSDMLPFAGEEDAQQQGAVNFDQSSHDFSR